jgi:hypothetical protein
VTFERMAQYKSNTKTTHVRYRYGAAMVDSGLEEFDHILVSCCV